LRARISLVDGLDGPVDQQPPGIVIELARQDRKGRASIAWAAASPTQLITDRGRLGYRDSAPADCLRRADLFNVRCSLSSEWHFQALATPSIS